MESVELINHNDPGIFDYVTNTTSILLLQLQRTRFSINSRHADGYKVYSDGFLDGNASEIRANGTHAEFRFLGGAAATHGTIETALISAVLLCIIFCTVVGNVLVCVAVFLVKKLRRPYNYLIVSLAVSDLCVAVLVMPMAAIYELRGKWPFGSITCDIWVSFDVLSCTASILNLCMISVDRYYAITKPLEYGVKRTPKRMVICVIVVWFLAACISLPPLLILGNDKDDFQCVVCQHFGYQIYATFAAFYIPLIVMVMVYVKIFKAARKIVMEEKRAQPHLEDQTYPVVRMSKRNSADAKLIAAELKAVAENGHHPNSRRVSTASCRRDSLINCYSSDRNSSDSQEPFLHQNGAPGQKYRRTSSILSNHTDDCKKHRGEPQKSTKFKIRTSLSNLKSRSLDFHARDFLHHINSTHSKKLRFHLAKERKASMTLGIIMSAFVFCWLPFFVLALVRPFLPDPAAIPNPLSSVFLWLGYVNSLLNPIIYATLNREFRKPFQEILFFRCSKLNNMMREDFYHSQYGEPEHYIGRDSHGAMSGDCPSIQEASSNSPKASESFL